MTFWGSSVIESILPVSHDSPLTVAVHTLLEALPLFSILLCASGVSMLVYVFLLMYLMNTYRSLTLTSNLFLKSFVFLYLGNVAGSVITSSALQRKTTTFMQQQDPLELIDWMASNMHIMMLTSIAGWFVAGIAVYYFSTDKKTTENMV